MDDELGVVSVSSWLGVDGSLGQFVKVERDCDKENSKNPLSPTRRLLLVPSSSTSGPCEITVKFQQTSCYVHRIYVQSSARTCEIYSQKESGRDLEYLCTVRAQKCLLSSEESLDRAPGFSSGVEHHEHDLSGFESLHQPLSSTQSEGSDTSSMIVKGSSSSDHSIHKGDQVLPAFDESLLICTSNPGDDMYQSCVEEITGRIVEAHVSYEDTVDQADWVQCSYSPVKTSVISSDDDVEVVELNRSDYYVVECHECLEVKQDKHQCACYFAGADRWSLNGTNYFNNVEDEEVNSKKPEMDRSSSCKAYSLQDEHLSCLQRSTEAHNSDSNSFCNVSHCCDSEKTSWSDSLCTSDLANFDAQDLNLFWARKLDNYPLAESKRGTFEDDSNAQSLLGNRQVDEVDCSSTGAVEDFQVGGKTFSSQSLSSSTLNVGHEFQKNNDVTIGKSYPPPQFSIYEAEVNLVNPEAWAGVTVRLLSLEDKSRVEVHRLVVSVVPCSPLQSPNPVGINQAGGSASFLAMLVPTMLQMGRGVPQPILGKPLAIPSTEVGRDSLGPTQFPRLPLNGAQSSCCIVNAEDEVITLGGDSKEDSPNFPEKSEPTVIFEGSLSPNAARKDNSPSGKVDEENLKAAEKEGDMHGYVVQRLDKLEAVCLRIENSLMHALQSFDRRLTLLESLTVGRVEKRLAPNWQSTLDDTVSDSMSLPVVFPSTGSTAYALNSGFQPSTSPLLLSSASSSVSSSRPSSPTPPLWPLSPNLRNVHISSSPPAESHANSCPVTPFSYALNSKSIQASDGFPSLPALQHKDGPNSSCLSPSGAFGSHVDDSHQDTDSSSNDSESDTSSEDTSYERQYPSSSEYVPKSLAAQGIDNAWTNAFLAFTTSYERAHVAQDERFQTEEEGRFVSEGHSHSKLFNVSVDSDPEASLVGLGEVDVHSQEGVLSPSEKEVQNLEGIEAGRESEMICLYDCQQELTEYDCGIVSKESLIDNMEAWAAIPEYHDELSLKDGTDLSFFSSDLQDANLNTFQDGFFSAKVFEVHNEKDRLMNPFLQDALVKDLNYSPDTPSWLQEWNGKPEESLKPIGIQHFGTHLDIGSFLQ